MHWFRASPLVPDAAFQDTTEPDVGHWRHFPEAWPVTPAGSPGAAARTPEPRAPLDAALARLPELWRRVLTARDTAGHRDQQVADELGLTLDQERDILALARAAVRDRLDHSPTDGGR
jgi:RNA polymerase sigma-70 factor (ECF subfamily)